MTSIRYTVNNVYVVRMRGLTWLIRAGERVRYRHATVRLTLTSTLERISAMVCQIFFAYFLHSLMLCEKGCPCRFNMHQGG
jgi:hypothetical protein